MLTLTLPYLYNHKGSSNINSHQHPNRPHHPPHYSWQQYQILSPWLRQGAFNSFYTCLEKLASGSRLATSSRRSSASCISDTFSVTRCYAFFFIVTMLTASCCDARRFYTNNRVGVLGGSKRVIRDAQNPSSDNSSLTPINMMASTDSSLPSSSSSPSQYGVPGKQQSRVATVPHKKDEGSIPAESATRAELINLLITTLEKLSVLEKTDSSCFRLEKIVQNIIDDSSSPPSSLCTASTPTSSDRTKLGVFLYFEEVHFPSINKSDTENVHVLNTNTSYNSSSRTVMRDKCVSHPIVDVHRGKVRPVEEMGENRHATVALEDMDNSTSETDDYGVLHTGGLSRTQIVVISTCSAIIGMFFLVAAFLRIRNYIKRSRLEQEIANRPKFRSCSVALRGATQSMEQLRRDSLASKTSHQNSDTTKGSNSSHTNVSSRENSSASSPRHDPDTAPLLLLTRAPLTNGPPTPPELEFIDEEGAVPRKKMNSTTDIHSDCRIQLSGQDSSAVIIMEVPGIKGSSKTLFDNADILKTTKQNGQLVSNKIEENINPSFSSGSTGNYALSGPEALNIEHLKRNSGNFNVINRTQESPHDSSERFIKEFNSNMDITQVHHSRHQIPVDQVGDITKCNDNILEEHCVQMDNSNRDNTPAGLTHVSVISGSQWQNMPGSLEKQTGAEESCEQNYAHMDTQTEDKLCPFSGISNFGLSQSDISLSSVTHQGNEFFGQIEYYHPHAGYEVCKTCCRGVNTNINKLNNVEAVANSAVSELSHSDTMTAAMAVHHVQPRLSSDATISELDDVAETNEQESISLSHTDLHTHKNPLVGSSENDEQLICDNGIKEITVAENVFFNNPIPPNCTTDPQESDTSTGETHLSNDATVNLNTNTPAGADEALSSILSELPSITSSTSHETLSDEDNHQSPEYTDQGHSIETNKFLVNKSVVQTLLPVSSTASHTSCQRFQATTCLPDQIVHTPQHFTTSIETPLPHKDPEQDDLRHNQLSMPLDHDKHFIHDHQENDTSDVEVKELCCMNNSLSPNVQSPSINNSDLCHQLLPLQTHTQIMNSSTC